MSAEESSSSFEEEEAVQIRICLAANDPTLTSVELTKAPSVDEAVVDRENNSKRSGAITLRISNPDEFQLATHAIRGNTFVERLSVVGGLTVTDDFLQHGLPTLPQLRHLQLQRAGLSVATAKTLVSSSNHWMKQLHTFNVSENANLGPRGCRQLAEGLRQMNGLLDLNMSGIRMGHYGSQALAEGSSHGALPRTLQRLNLSRNGIGPDGLWKLAEAALPALTALQHLDLSYNNILDDGCLEIAKLLAQHASGWTTLRLAGNGIGDSGVTGLARALGDYQTRSRATDAYLLLEELDLSDNRITDVGATALAQEALSCARPNNQQEGEVDEEEEESSEDEDDDEDEGDASIPDAEHVGEQRHQWKLLNLSKNQIENAGCSALAMALSNSTTSTVVVQSLDLSHNSIGDEGAGAFVELLDDMVGLVELHLSGNPELTQARTRILDMLLKHRRHDETVTDHSERSEHTQATAVSVSSSQIIPQQQQHLPKQEFDHSMGTMNHQLQDQIRIENERNIEEGRVKLMACLFACSCSSDGRGSGRIIEIPHAYASHLTENFSAQRILQYGAFGPLYTATVRNATAEAAKTENSEPLVYIRHLKLGGCDSGTLNAREAIVQELIELGAREEHANLWLPVAYTKSFCFVYANNNSLHHRTTLTTWLRDENRRRQLTWKARVHCLRAVAQALAFLHSHEAGHKFIFHGDVCSQNIFLLPQSNDDKQQHDNLEFSFQLADGGLSRLLATDRARFEAGDVIFGSRGYRCPRYERGSCPYDSASDMFSFGIVVAEMTTGRLQRSKQEPQTVKTNASSSSSSEPTRSSQLAWDAYYELSGIQTNKPTIPVDPKAGPVPKTLIEIIAKILLSCVTPLVERRPSSTTVANILNQISFV